MKRSSKSRAGGMKAKDFDRAFDGGADVSGALEPRRAVRPLQQARRVNVDFPAWMIESLDREAGRLGVTRQSIIKGWIAERLAAATGRG
ncbi:MAG: hypothetical protein WD072_06680 [Pirellulales bacterium]